MVEPGEAVPGPRPRLLIVVNDPAFFLSHRVPIAQAACDEGFDVHIATGPGAAVEDIVERGFVHHLLPLTRSGSSPINEARALLAILRLLRRLSPSVAHFVTIKPVIYGGIAARLAGIPAVLAVSGLGTVFSEKGLRAAARRSIVQPMYRLALRHRDCRIIVQNSNDQAILERIGGIDANRFRLIKGSGVDFAQFPDVPAVADSPPIVIMAARLLEHKGVREFVAAARMLRDRGLSARFCLAGSPDPGNPGSVTASDLAEWEREGFVELLGHRDDVPALLAGASIVCLPSYYGEGMPKVLLEAAASGRPAITTDHPGCRDAIIPGETGLLVPPRDAPALASAIQRLLEDPAGRRSMGAAARQHALREFAIQGVVLRHLAIYRELLPPARITR